MGHCHRCGRPGLWTQGLCPECIQSAALEEKNKIETEHLKQEERYREEQRRREQDRDEQDRRHREDLLKQNQKFHEEQLRIEKERSEQERENHLREIEAQEEANRIERERLEAEQQRYEEEKWEREQEKLAQEWEDRKLYLDTLSDSEMVVLFEDSADARERSYLQQRYRSCVTSEDYLEFIKDEGKYLAKKKISRFVNSHSKEESLNYLLNVDPRWFDQIVEKDHLLDGLLEMSPEMQNKCSKYTTSKQRQEFLRIDYVVKQFKKKSSVDKQIFFREFVRDKYSGRVYNPEGYCDEIGIIYSQIEPLYIEALDPKEQKIYLKNKQNTEKKYYDEKKRIEEHRIARENTLKNCKKELEEKWNENEKLVAECNKINQIVANRITLRENIKKQRKSTLKFGCIVPFFILFLMGITEGTGNQTLLLSEGIIIILFAIAIPLRAIIASIKIIKIKRDNAKDETTQNSIVERSQQLVNRIRELQKIISGI